MNPLSTFSIKTRLIVNVILIHAVLMGFIVVDMLEREKGFMLEQLHTKGKDITTIVASNASQYLLNNDIVALNELISEMHSVSNIHMVFIMDKRGRVKASQPAKYFNQKLNDAQSLALREQMKKDNVSIVQIDHDAFVDTLVRVKLQERTIGYVRTLLDAGVLQDQLQIITIKGMIYVMIAILVGSLFAWLSVREMTRRLTLVVTAAHEIAERRFNVRLPSFKEKDEVGLMIEAFGVMQDSLQTYIREIDESEQRLNLALEGSSDGLWDWDFVNERVYYSPRWKEMLGFSDEELENSFETWKRLLHPDDAEKSIAFVAHFMRSGQSNYEQRFRLRCKNGEYIPILARAKKVQDAQGKTVRLIGTHVDLSEITKVQEKLRYQAEHDALTGLPNRVLFMDRVKQSLKHAKRYHHQVAVLFLDLDHFKEVNDSFGHDVGDSLLISVASLLQQHIRESDTISRFGGDEFAIVLDQLMHENQLIDIVEKIQLTMDSMHQVKNYDLFNTFSIGIAIYPQDGSDATTLLKNADAAMYKAKKLGRNNYQFYTADMTQKAIERITLEKELRQAVSLEQLEVYYQPQVNIRDKRIIGMEALVRWKRESGAFCSPAVFIPLAEEIGLITTIDIIVMKKVVSQIVAWHSQGFIVPRIAINLSTVELSYYNQYIDQLEATLRESSCDPSLLEVEITESLFIRDIEATIAQLKRVEAMGIAISIDDFGTGYSSLAYIKKLPVYKLKIDKSFVDDIAKHQDDEEVVKTIIAMAKNLNLRVIAEGVETKEQVDFLNKNGCLEVQGYYFYRPMPPSDIQTLLQ